MKIIPTILLILLFSTACLYSQMDELHGDYGARAMNVHSGNRLRITFFNDGMFGRKNDALHYGGDWPKNNINKARYIPGSSQLVGSEVIDNNGQKIHIVSESDVGMSAPSTGDRSPTGDWWTFLPLPGFHNPQNQAVAMSHDKTSWPGFWPDKIQAEDPGWVGSWNGYFGRDQFNADQESYFITDDYNNLEFDFYPDTTNLDRGGLGIRITTRGLQWTNVLVEDILFMLFDIKNIGTHLHDRIVFGNKTGFTMGSSTTAGDGADDMGKFILEEDLAVAFDYDDRGAPGGWSPVGFVGVAYLESPGYPYDGIDNDADGANGSGDIISEQTFEPRAVNQGDLLVFIDYTTFERTVARAFIDTLDNPYYYMKNDSIKLMYLKQEFLFTPGDTLYEIEVDNLDNNFNGIIDENNGSRFGKDPNNQIQRYLYVGNKFINYITGNGLDNPMIDERRDDGIDNNNNWEILDDVGLDGNKYTLDTGQGDGRPTSGWQNGVDTGLPGEPHIDKTDINESDMIGLTAFELVKPYSSLPSWDDELLWEHLKPGYLDDIVLIGDDTDMAFGSGYFAMIPEQIERYSMSLQLAYTEPDLIRVKHWGGLAYAENYQFAKAPDTPELTLVAGDGKVILYWDEMAEYSIDPLEGKDFEGYRIYRSTDPLWSDMETVRDVYGNRTYYVPVAQFDLVNEYEGYFPETNRGAMFNLGENTGLTHSWVDTTVANGIKYYYAITSYDHGSASYNIPPTECPIIMDVNSIGEIERKGINVGVVTPGVNVAGMETLPEGTYPVEKASGYAEGYATYKIVSPTEVKGQHTYRVTFADTFEINSSALLGCTLNPVSYSVFDITDHQLVADKYPYSSSAVVIDGVQLAFNFQDELELDVVNSQWSRADILPYSFTPQVYRDSVAQDIIVGNFRIEFGDVGLDTSIYYELEERRICEAIPVNFSVTNLLTNKKVPFAFYEQDDRTNGDGFFSVRAITRPDEIIFLKWQDSTYVKTWSFKLIASESLPPVEQMPQNGDYIDLIFKKPISRGDTLFFTTPQTPEYDESLATSNLEKISVVPNPYIVTNEFEPVNYYDQGRGDRALHFVNLPVKCTIRIYTLSGQLVDVIEHSTDLYGRGEAVWDMMSKENMDIGFGVYVYHVDAGKLG
ncbi:hypothetical protein JW935_00250, partial [candidate division KSB1 bacterium]|nr:hypothetical protein [candidate division KSB1 bacterium]